jgi:hypothetical protein
LHLSARRKDTACPLTRQEDSPDGHLRAAQAGASGRETAGGEGTFGDSQNGLIRRLGLEDEITQSDLSAFERGTREPPLHVLLRYSQLARVWVNALIDDAVDLPERIPTGKMREGVVRVSSKKRGRRGG